MLIAKSFDNVLNLVTSLDIVDGYGLSLDQTLDYSIYNPRFTSEHTRH